MKPTYRKSWAGNLLMWTDLTLVSSFKVKQWFTGFVDLCSLALLSCLSSGYKFTSFLLCVGLVDTGITY